MLRSPYLIGAKAYKLNPVLYCNGATYKRMIIILKWIFRMCRLPKECNVD